VDASTPIAQIVNNSQLHLDLFVFEKDLPKVKAGQRIHFTLTKSAGKEYDAQIYSIETAFASQSKTYDVEKATKAVENSPLQLRKSSVGYLASLRFSAIDAFYAII
jgi:multidrug resistance efflux pump